MWEKFECERFVIGLVGFMVRKVCDNSRAGSCYEKIKGVTISNYQTMQSTLIIIHVGFMAASKSSKYNLIVIYYLICLNLIFN